MSLRKSLKKPKRTPHIDRKNMTIARAVDIMANAMNAVTCNHKLPKIYYLSTIQQII